MRDDTANWVLKVPRSHATATADWISRAKSLFAAGATSRAVAAEMGYGSVGAFSKLFKRRTGLLPPDSEKQNGVRSTTYRRVDEARRLLLTGNYSVDQVVRLAGFTNRQGLDKAFKRVYGMLPAEWLKWLRKGVVISIAAAEPDEIKTPKDHAVRPASDDQLT